MNDNQTNNGTNNFDPNSQQNPNNNQNFSQVNPNDIYSQNVASNNNGYQNQAYPNTTVPQQTQAYYTSPNPYATNQSNTPDTLNDYNSQNQYNTVPQPVQNNYDYSQQNAQPNPAYSPYNSSNTQLPLDPYASQTPANEYANPAPITTPNTFTEKNSGNRNLIIALVSLIILVVLVISGILYFLNSSGRLGSSSSSSSSVASSVASSSSSISSSQSSSSSSSSLSPSPLKVLKNATTLPADWLKQNFLTDGTCSNVSICGENADPDNDGLKNIDEHNYGTDPQNPDTDNDGISDGDEVYNYEINPLSKNTSGLVKTDLENLVACIDPTNTLGTKFTTSKLLKISNNVALKPLKTKTIDSLKKSSATDADLTKGYISAVCGTTTSSSTGSSTTSTTSSTTTNTPSISF